MSKNISDKKQQATQVLTHTYIAEPLHEHAVSIMLLVDLQYWQLKGT